MCMFIILGYNDKIINGTMIIAPLKDSRFN